MSLHPETTTVAIKSIHDNMDLSSIMPDMILDYMRDRAESTPFSNDPERRSLMDIVDRCIEEGQSRVLSHSKPGTVESVTVTTSNGVRIELSDFYSFLALLVTETDPVVFRKRPTSTDERDLIHHRMLFTFAKWMDICANEFFNETAPPTACLMYVDAPVEQISATTPRSPRSDAAGPYRYWLRTAIFPNLAKGHFHQAGPLIQQTNLRTFIPDGPDFGGKSSLQLIGKHIQFADCSETLPLIYLLNPRPTRKKLYLRGMTIDVTQAVFLPHFDYYAVRGHLKPACNNCVYMLRAIGTHLRVPEAPNSIPLAYRDQAPTATAQFLPEKPNCFKFSCPTKGAYQEFECKNCRLLWWCCEECKDKSMEQHLTYCRRFHVCALPKCLAQRVPNPCPQCKKVAGRIPAYYCNGKHREADLENHKSWCEDVNNKGPVPSLLAAGYTVQI